MLKAETRVSEEAVKAVFSDIGAGVKSGVNVVKSWGECLADLWIGYGVFLSPPAFISLRVVVRTPAGLGHVNP